MPLPALNIPLLDQSRRPKPYLRVKQLRQWLQSLPTANTRKTIHLFIEQLNTLNQSNYPVHERIQLLDELRPIARQLLITLKQQLKRADIPLNQKNQDNYQNVQDILSQMATGYKIAVSMLAQAKSRKEHDDLVLREAIYLSIQYLSRKLLEAYLVYREEPEKIWLELNQLYLYAEHQDILHEPLDDPYPDFSLPVHYTIDLVYKRIILLSLSEPYHLMHNEAEDVYYLVSAWTSTCELLPATAIAPDDEYVIDLATDHAPRYASGETDWSAEEGRIIDIDEVKKRLDVHLQRMLTSILNSLDEDGHQMLVLRRQRDMLLRLADAWHGALKRQSARADVGADVRMATGLNAAHYYVSQEHEFTPAVDELKLKLDAEEIEPTVYAIAYESAMQQDRFHLNKDYTINPWWQHNTSRMGSALACTAASGCSNVKVGEIVSYFSEQEHSPVHWKIGVIRWLKIRPEVGLDMGIMNIADSAVPVASKAIKGPGLGTDYFRCLLIPKQVSLKQQRSVIVPTSIYDIDSVLSINMKRRLFYIKLTRLLLSTSSFAQFEFEVLETPPTDSQIFIG